jgi:hypothetical protein
MDRGGTFGENMIQQRTQRAIVAGFCASAASALVLLFAHIVAKILHMGSDGRGTFGALIDNDLTVLASSNLYLAISLHFIVGMSLGYLFMKVRPSLPKNPWTAGLIFLTPPFLLSVFVLFPLTGGGFFGLLYGAGILPTLGSLVLHVVYGLMMVGLYEGPEALSYGASQQNRFKLGTPPTNYGHAVIGIVYGSIIGATVAACLWFLLRDTVVIPGLPLEFTFMALTFFFSAMGLLIGFWTGAPVRGNRGRPEPAVVATS